MTSVSVSVSVSVTVQNDLKDLKINLSIIEISTISKQTFKKIVRKACEQSAFYYLLEQTAKLSKGSEITYTKLEIQNYLGPEIT